MSSEPDLLQVAGAFFSSALPPVLILEQIFSTGKKQAHPDQKHPHELIG